MRKYGSKAARTRLYCGCCWSACSHDPSTQQHTDMDRRWGDRFAAWFHGSERPGAKQVGTVPDVGSGFCVSWTAGRSDQGSVVRWRWSLFIREAVRERTLCVAAGQQWERGADPSAVVDVVGGHRLAPSATHVGS